MDFELGEDLTEVQSLARTIFGAEATTDRLRAVETTESRTDARLWSQLAAAGLLGIALPEEQGGAGLGLAGLAVVLEEQGRHVAPAPVWSAAVAALVLSDAGDQHDLVPGLADGTARVALALEEFGAHSPLTPRATGARDGDRWVLSGTKAAVPTPDGASHVLVSASTDDGAGLFLVANEGLTWEHAHTTTHDRAGHLTLTETPAVALGRPGDDTLAAVVDLATVAVAALQVGVAEGALRLAASYVSERQQFGRPLGTFQAVQHQLADCWIDVDAMRVTLWQAVQAVEHRADDPREATRAALVAKWWCDQAGLDVVHRVQHVHGGMGVDVDYPVHRYFLWGKQLSSTLGGAGAALADLGALIARSA